jgi:type I restriction enzyme, S subunit
VTALPITIELGDVMATKSGSVDPSKFSDEVFDLYSIPAFDRGEPDIAIGADIGSAKQIVEPGDVLLSKIVPHIRRSWVVGPNRGRRLIASGEWIVFRSAQLHPPYLRHTLIGDPFHAQFMRTVSGVGGSLLRARPSHVANIRVPLPPLPEQRRIAEILDKADALRAKRRAALAQLDTLTQTIFLDMFGDPATNPYGFPTGLLASLVREGDTINYGVVQPGDDHDDDEGVPMVRVGDLIEGKVRHSGIKRIAPSIEAAYKRSRLRGDEILVSCVGSIGVVALANDSVKGFNIARAVARIPLAETTNRLFMAAYLSTDFVQRYFTNELRTVSQPTLNIKQISETTVVLPSFSLQCEFAWRVTAVEALKTAHRAALAELDALFASLQHRAFRGDIVSGRHYEVTA